MGQPIKEAAVKRKKEENTIVGITHPQLGNLTQK